MEGEGSSTKEEEEVSERTATFYLYHPCYFLEEALRALFKCLGFEIGTNREQKNSVVKAPSVSEENSITQENTESYNQKTCQEAADPPPTTAADQEHSSTSQNCQLIASIMVMLGSRRPDLSKGSDPQTN